MQPNSTKRLITSGVNGAETFTQHNWYDCNPNPDNCQPQNGTWYHNRAGWCPGAIAQWFDYDLSTYITQGSINLDYVFYNGYVDLCHPNNPSCVTGVTCDDCSAGFNPHLIVACNLVEFSTSPIDNGAIVGVDDIATEDDSYISLFPNPSDGMMELSYRGNKSFGKATVSILSITGNLYDQFEWHGETKALNLTSLPNGVYFVKIKKNDNTEVRKIMIM